MNRATRVAGDRAKRPLRSLVLYIAILGMLLALTFLSISEQFPLIAEDASLGSNLSFFALINLNIIVVMVLGFMVIKNVVKLLLDRRRGAVGSGLRLRLVAAFVGLSLVPAVLLFMVAKGILSTVLQGWFSPQVQSAVDAALGVAKQHYDSEEARVFRYVRHLSLDLSTVLPYTSLDNPAERDANLKILKRVLDSKREEYGLQQIAVVDRQGGVLVESLGIEAGRGDIQIPYPNLRAIQDSLTSASLVAPERSIDGDFLRGYSPIVSSSRTTVLSFPGGTPGERYPAPKFVVLATSWVTPELDQTLGRVISSYDDYRELKTYRRPLASNFLLTLVIVTLMIVFSAIWVGFYLAKTLTIPIQLVAEGTQQVAQGNLDYQLPEVGDDELGVLVHSFNTMTGDLKRTTGELVARRQYMETVLASVAVGVVSVDSGWRVTTLNSAAADILHVERSAIALGKAFKEVAPVALSERVSEMRDELFASPEKTFTSTLSLDVGGKSKQIQVTVTKLMSAQGEFVGAVVLLDDLTELVSAQRMAAWREVARRIAHEIKNPLTPIQLSAQRMQRRFAQHQMGPDAATDQTDRKLVADCTETIVSQVNTLRTLVNEFSRFARMPKTQLRSGDLNTLVQDTVSIYREANPEVLIDVELDERLPEVEIDREQMGRVLVNLLDNALASVLAKSCQENGSGRISKPQIVLRSFFDEALGLVSLSVTDNGIGIADADRGKLFEPYFTTKKGGTGLGLAIVHNIVSDHNGFVRLRDGIEGGASFVIELPVNRRPDMAREA